jgi:curved DNA-binding protein CbpA
MLKTYYDIFKIPKNATKNEITAAYKTLMEKYSAHYEGDDFDKKAAILEKAYRVLTNPQMRAKYDSMLSDMAAEAGETKRAASPPKEDMTPKRSAARMEEPAVKRPVVRTMMRDDDEYEEAPKNRKKLTGLIIAIVVAFLLIAGGGFYFYNYMYLPESHYKEAFKQANAGQYDKAISELKKLKNYRDSEKQIVNITLAKGNSLVNAKKYDEALKVFDTMTDKTKKTKAKKDMAENLLSAKEYDRATAIYEDIGDEEGVNNCKYTRAVDYVAAKKNDEAYTLFKELGEFKDSADKLTELKTVIQKSITDELETMTQQMFSIMPTAKEYVVKLSALQKQAETYELDDAKTAIEEKWTTVESIYYGAYLREAGILKATKNDTYFETALMTETKSTSDAVDNATTHFAEKPEYVSLYLKCLAGVSAKTLNVTWYKYKLDRTTGDYTERDEVFKSEAKELKKITKNLAVIFASEKDGFTYGAGLYAAEVTVAGETAPSALLYFYLQ